MGTAWLRQVDEDAASGVLWRRPVFYVPVYLLTGVLLGAVLGGAGGLVFAMTRPDTSVIPGPDGAPVMMAHDYSMVPIIGGLLGAVLGLVAGGESAARRWRRSR